VKPTLLLIGSPGVGKTTGLIKAVEALKMKGVSVGDMISREVLENSIQIGVDLRFNQRQTWMAGTYKSAN
jgi:nucleoside-triphosphatase THEP1